MARTGTTEQLGRKLTAGATALALLLLFLPSASAQGAPGGEKIARDVQERLRAAGPDDLVPVIVQTHDEPTSGHFARLHGRGGSVKARHSSIRGYSAKVPASQVEALAGDPEVERISYDEPVRAHMDVAYPAVKADAAFIASAGLDGQGVGIAIVDTGVVGHPDLLRAKGTPQPIEVEIVGHESGLADYYGHGTHVAGIINGNGRASTGRDAFRTFKGLAPGSQIISIRSLAPDGTGFTSDIIAGIDWAIRYKASYNIRVLNLSLGHPVYESYRTDPLCRAVRAAYDAGIVVVVSAGNDGGIGSGFGTITSPGNEPTAITVGAMDDGNTVTTTDDVLAWYSSKGPSLTDYVVKPDLVAPGTWIVSLRSAGSYLDTSYHGLTLKIGEYRNDPRLADRDGDYYNLSGTSMAAPFVAATAALLIQKDPGITPATVKARLMKSAVKDDRLMFETGAGYLDVDAALEATGTAYSADSPRAMLASDGSIYVEDTSIIWGAESWSLTYVWGGQKGEAHGILLSDVPESITSADTAVWGGKGGKQSIVENNQVTSAGLIWTGCESSLPATTDTVDILTAVWGGKGGKP